MSVDTFPQRNEVTRLKVMVQHLDPSLGKMKEVKKDGESEG